ncbi:MAG: hypothetical protein SGPRY_006244, partial [Prymnesium sp.]
RESLRLAIEQSERANKALEEALKELRGETNGPSDSSPSISEQALREIRGGEEAMASSTSPQLHLPLPLPLSSPRSGEEEGSNQCLPGCEEWGNCNRLTGECSCPFTREGSACQKPTMPDCATGGGRGDVDGFVNLAGLVGERFWWNMRDLRLDGTDKRRLDPPHRWVGLVTCRCVEQAVSRFSLMLSPQPASYPPGIGLAELALQRVLCVDEPERTTGEVWKMGPSHGVRPLSHALLCALPCLDAHPHSTPSLTHISMCRFRPLSPSLGVSQLSLS